jgi:hypothetical protein
MDTIIFVVIALIVLLLAGFVKVLSTIFSSLVSYPVRAEMEQVEKDKKNAHYRDGTPVQR